MIKTIIYENYNLLGNSRLAYMSTADAQHVTGSKQSFPTSFNNLCCHFRLDNTLNVSIYPHPVHVFFCFL